MHRNSNGSDGLNEGVIIIGNVFTTFERRGGESGLEIDFIVDEDVSPVGSVIEKGWGFQIGISIARDGSFDGDFVKNGRAVSLGGDREGVIASV